MFRTRSGRIVPVLLAALLIAGCQRPEIVPDDGWNAPGPPRVKEYKGLIPQHPDGLPRVSIVTPHRIKTKKDWVGPSRMEISAFVDGVDSLYYVTDSLNIRGRGNSTWTAYPKKSYSLKLQQKANFISTGSTKRWVLLANWMDRTLLRTDVAFEAARRTSIEWTPSGTFVDLYLNGSYDGVYWLGERIHVEGSNFLADYLYSFDSSDTKEWQFYTLYGRWRHGSIYETGGMPVELKYPDPEDIEDEAQREALIARAQEALAEVERALYEDGDWESKLDLNSFCDWFLVYELCCNVEPRHPKSCFFYLRDGVLYAGPVWDFDWNTFTLDKYTLQNRYCLYFNVLMQKRAFVDRLKYRWKTKLRWEFLTLPEYIDKRADLIRESEDWNHNRWPCYPNPLAEDGNGEVNHDEQLTFQEAVDRMKEAIYQRIEIMDYELDKL